MYVADFSSVASSVVDGLVCLGTLCTTGVLRSVSVSDVSFPIGKILNRPTTTGRKAAGERENRHDDRLGFDRAPVEPPFFQLYVFRAAVSTPPSKA